MNTHKKPYTSSIRSKIKESAFLSRFYRDEAKRLFERARNTSNPHLAMKLRQDAFAFRARSAALASDQHHRLTALRCLTGKPTSFHGTTAEGLATSFFMSGLFKTREEAKFAAQQCIDGHTLVETREHSELLSAIQTCQQDIRTKQDQKATARRYLERAEIAIKQGERDKATHEAAISRLDTEITAAKTRLDSLQQQFKDTQSGPFLPSNETTPAAA